MSRPLPQLALTTPASKQPSDVALPQDHVDIAEAGTTSASKALAVKALRRL